MPTETSLPVDFDSPEIREFARSADTELKDPAHASKRDFLIAQGYRETNLTRQGQPFNPANHIPADPITGTSGILGIIQAEIKTYDLIQNATSAILSQVETQTIHSQAVEVIISHELFLADSLSPEEQENIKSAFKNFVDGPDTNPDDFAAQNNIPAASYEALAYFELRKSGAQTVDDRQDRAIRSYYTSDETHQLKYRNSRFDEVKERDDGAVEVDDPEDGSSVIGILAQIVETSPAMRCGNIQYKETRVGTLIQYPEFKINWRRVVIKIGCIRISIKVPQLMYRITKRVLYAGLAYSADVGQIVVDVVVHCLQKSAVAATIAGIATANIAVAGAAFKALFTECIKQQLNAYIKCLLPDLILLKEKGGWKPV